MTKTYPNKWVKKAVFDAINNIVVDGITIPCYNTRVTGVPIPQHYVLLTTQTNRVDKAVKCEDKWDSSILIDVVTTYDAQGNTGSTLLADNIMDRVKTLTSNLTLDVASGLTIQKQRQDFPNNISTITNNENIFRNLMRIEMTIN